jgi:uncharacterized protein YlaN (UPF0358 family)
MFENIPASLKDAENKLQYLSIKRENLERRARYSCDSTEFENLMQEMFAVQEELQTAAKLVLVMRYEAATADIKCRIENEK